MPITLNDFLVVSNGTYNAGQIDFKTNKKGEVTGLKKVNNHVTLSSRNAVAIDPKRAVAVKEAFLKALAGGGVSEQNLANIRAKLGLAPETRTTLGNVGEALQRRFTPLTREQVRDILRNDSGLGLLPGAADSKKVRDARARVDAQIASLVRKSPPHEQLFALLSGKSCKDSALAAMSASPDMMKVLAGLRLNRNDTLFQNAFNRVANSCLNRQARTLAMLRNAVAAFAADPAAGPQSVQTPFGAITLSSVAEEAMNATRLVASVRIGSETLTVDLGVSPAEVAGQLDRQISEDAALLGRERLGAMLSYAKKHGGVGEDGDPGLGRTVAQAILRTFAGVGQELLDELDNLSLSSYARDVVKGTAEWTEDSIRAARNEALRNPNNVQVIAEVTGEIEAGDEEDQERVSLIVDRANDIANGGNEEKIEEPPPQNEVPPQRGEVPPPQNEIPQPQGEVPPQEEPPLPPQDDKFEKLFGAPLAKDAEDIRPGRAFGPARNPLDDRLSSVESGDGEVAAHFKATLERARRRAEEMRIFNEVTLLFERKRDVPADDKASSVKTGKLDAPKHFEAAMKTENFTFLAAKLPQPERKAIGDFALGLLKGAATGDKAALKALVAANLHSFLLMAADPAGAAAFFPPEAVADAKGLVAALAQELKAAAKAGAGRDVDFRSFTQGDEDAVRAMLGRGKNPEAADALAGAFARILRETVSASVLEASAEALQAAGAALAGASADALAAFARKDPLALAALASGDAKLPGRNAAQTAELKAAVRKAFAEATGKSTLAEATLAEFDAFAKKCADGAFDKAFAAIAARNELLESDLYREVAGSKDKVASASVTSKDLGSVPRAPQTAEARKGDIVGGVTLRVSELLDTDAPRPRDATPADLRNLTADLFDAAEAILGKAPKASAEDLRKIMLGNIDAFCRFLDNSRAVGDAVPPQLRELVVAAMDDVRATMRAAIAAALGKEIRDVRPVEIKRYLQQMDLSKDAAAAAAMGKVAAAFAKLAEQSAAPLQSYVNEVCRLDPKAKIASEYDRMKPDDITASLSKKTLDDILDDPVKDSTRPGMLAFQKKVLSTYFTTVSHARKAGVLSSALRNAPEAADAGTTAGRTKFLSAIFLGAGPLMQKTLQGIDRRVMGPHGGAIDVLKSSIPPIPDSYVLAKLDEIAKQNPDKYTMRVNVGGKPFVTLGAATVGQAVLCSFMNDQGGIDEVIVKILRPGVKERFDEDVKIFDAVAKGIPSVDKVWQARVRTIADEFDFRVEAKNIQDGQVYEVRDNRYVMVQDKKSGKMVPKVDAKTGKRVHVPGAEHTWTVSAMKVPEGVKQSADVLVGEVAPGQPFDKVLARQTQEIHNLFAGVFETDADGRIVRKDGKPVVRKDMSAAGFLAIHNKIEKAVRDISESGIYFKQVVWKWVDEALFKSGTMHNDVHTGNLMLDTEGQRATFIDFGNLVKLAPEERVLLLKMVATVAAKHTTFFVDTFGELLGKGTPEYKAYAAQRDKIEAAVRQVIHKGLAEADTGYRFQAILCELQKLGVDIPPKVAAFAEGLTRLQNCHEEIAELLQEAQSLYHAYEEQVVRGNPVLAPRDPEDAIGRLLDLMAKPDGIQTIVSLSDIHTPLAKALYDARMNATDLAWFGMDNKVKGSLVEKMRKAMKEEESLPGNDKLANLVSLVSRHVGGAVKAEIDDALADYASRKRSFRAATLSGAADLDKLRENLVQAADRLERAVAKGVESIDMAINDLSDAKPPREDDFETETAAEIFADIVNENVDAVKKSFTGLIGKGRIANAFRNATKDDPNHQHDGHRKVRTNKL